MTQADKHFIDTCKKLEQDGKMEAKQTTSL